MYCPVVYQNHNKQNITQNTHFESDKKKKKTIF